MMPPLRHKETGTSNIVCSLLSGGLLCILLVSHTSGGAAEHSDMNGSVSPSARTTCQPHCPPEANGQIWASKEDRNATQTSPNQAGHSPASSSTGNSGDCRQEIPIQENFLDKVIRVLFRPNRCGHSQDVDTNISAGGAGGG